ncbi:MAG: hypothetical protein II670_01520 [Alphaproteobacteria bacterium]|nr:hypothetical protein [Alphaproteobacteria bacterium]
MAGHTDYLIFSDGESGKRVFDKISELAKNEDSRSLVEWDYYMLRNGYGELSTSHKKDAMVHATDRYKNDNTISWDHYHPNNELNAWYPSYSDQQNARDLQNGKFGSVRCSIHFCGLTQRFDKIVFYRNYNPSELKMYFKSAYINSNN